MLVASSACPVTSEFTLAKMVVRACCSLTDTVAGGGGGGSGAAVVV